MSQLKHLVKGLFGPVRYRKNFDLYPANLLDRNSQIVAVEVVRSQYEELAAKRHENPVKELQTILNPQASIKNDQNRENTSKNKNPTKTSNKKETRKVTRTSTKISGVETFIYTPQGFESLEKQNKAIFYHGGAWCFGSVKMHSQFISAFAKAGDCQIYAPDYSKSPEQPFPVALDQCKDVTNYLLEKYPDKTLNLIGDSSGGNFAASILHDLVQVDNQNLPKSVALIYPFLQVYRLYDSHRAPRALNSLCVSLVYLAALNYSGLEVNKTNLAYLQTLVENNENDDSDLAKFLRNPRVSPLLASDDVFKKVIDSGVKILIDTAEYDLLQEEANLYYKKLKDMEMENLESNVGSNVEIREAVGSVHCWAQILAPTGNSHRLPILGEVTPENALEVKKMLKSWSDMINN